MAVKVLVTPTEQELKQLIDDLEKKMHEDHVNQVSTIFPGLWYCWIMCLVELLKLNSTQTNELLSNTAFHREAL